MNKWVSALFCASHVRTDPVQSVCPGSKDSGEMADSVSLKTVLVCYSETIPCTRCVI